jgi:hypothetical protein
MISWSGEFEEQLQIPEWIQSDAGWSLVTCPSIWNSHLRGRPPAESHLAVPGRIIGRPSGFWGAMWRNDGSRRRNLT